VARRYKIGSRREAYAGGYTRCPKGVYELASWKIECSDNRIQRRRYQPSRVWRKRLHLGVSPVTSNMTAQMAYRVEYTTPESTQFAHDSTRLGIYDANYEVVASDSH
jgi:hypothetical protein